MNDRPAVYVGTYAKYNNGSLKGKWLYLDDYADKDEFVAACRALHKDEADPEGQAESKAAWAEQYLEETGGLDKVPENLRNYIDFEAWARDAGVTFVRYKGELWVFHG